MHQAGGHMGRVPTAQSQLIASFTSMFRCPIATGTRRSFWRTWRPWAAACPPCSPASGAVHKGVRERHTQRCLPACLRLGAGSCAWV